MSKPKIPDLCGELMASLKVPRLEDENAALTKRAELAESRLEHNTDWYHQRFNRLRTWALESVKPLSELVTKEYFAIVANGSPSPHESADWTNTMHALKLRLERAEKRVAELEAMREVNELRAQHTTEQVAEIVRLDAHVKQLETYHETLCSILGAYEGRGELSLVSVSPEALLRRVDALVSESADLQSQLAWTPVAQGLPTEHADYEFTYCDSEQVSRLDLVGLTHEGFALVLSGDTFAPDELLDNVDYTHFRRITLPEAT